MCICIKRSFYIENNIGELSQDRIAEDQEQKQQMKQESLEIQLRQEYYKVENKS